MGLKFTTFEIEIQDEFRFRLINKPYGIENDPFSVCSFSISFVVRPARRKWMPIFDEHRSQLKMMFVWHAQAFAPRNAHLRWRTNRLSKNHLRVKEPALRAGVKSKPSELMKDDRHETNSAAAAAVSELMLSLVRKRKRRRTLVQWAAVLLAFEDEMAEAGREDIMPRRVYFRPDYS